MAPPIMVILPFYLAYKNLNLLDTTTGLILIYTTFNLAFVVWMMRGYFKSIPVDLEDAARIDGASRLKALLTVTLPLSAPGIAAAKTARVAITSFITFERIRWGEVSAAGVLIVMPVLVFGLIIQRYLVQGLTMGSVK